MDTKIDLTIQNFVLAYTAKKDLDDKDMQTLLDEVCKIYDLDNVYIIERLLPRDVCVYSFISSKPFLYVQKGMEIMLNKNNVLLAEAYDDENLSEQSIDDTRFPHLNNIFALHYGYFENGIFQADLGFQTLREREWTSEEREAIKKLAYAIKGYLSIQSASRFGKLYGDIEKVKKAYSVCGYIDLDSGRYEIINRLPWQAAFFAVKGKLDDAFKNMVSEIVDEPFREIYLERFSIKNIKKELSLKRRKIELDYYINDQGKKIKWRTSVVLLDTHLDGTPFRAIFVIESKEAERSWGINEEILKRKKSYTSKSYKNFEIMQIALSGIPGGFKVSQDDAKFTYKYISEEVAALQGFTIQEYLTHTNGNLVDNTYVADRMLIYEKILADYAKGDKYSCKYRVQCKDGTWKWILDSGCKVIKESGEVEHYSFVLDIDEFEKNATKLNNTLTLFNQVLSSLSCGIFAYSLPEHNILVMNEEARRIFGVSKADHFSLDHFFRNNVLEEDMPAIRNKVSWLRKSGDKAEYTFRVRNNTGEIKTIQARTKLLRYEDDSYFILSSILDLSEQERLNRILIKERRQYRDALTSSCAFYFSFDVTEGIIWNEKGENGYNSFEDFGVSPPIHYDDFVDKFIEMNNYSVIDSSTNNFLKQKDIIEHFSNGETHLEMEYYYTIKNKFVRVSMLLSEDENTKHIYAFTFVQDTTEQRRKEEETKKELTKAYEVARRANAAKSDFLSKMSHDIRTPMNAIMGMTVIAQNHLAQNKRVDECLNKIAASSKHLLGIINEILDMSKIESGKMELNEEEFNLLEVLENMLVMIKNSIRLKKQNLHIHLEVMEHEQVVGDRLRTEQVLVNLLSNAVKYTPDYGDIYINVNENKCEDPDKGVYECTIRDTGIGMDEEFISHMFEPFTRASDSRVDNIQGTGLGLAIAYNIVKMMNGEIKVTSKLAEGTTIKVCLPFSLGENQEDPIIEKLEGLEVLVVDDVEQKARDICAQLESLKLKVHYAISEEEAAKQVIKAHEEKRDYLALFVKKGADKNNNEIDHLLRNVLGEKCPVIIWLDWLDLETQMNDTDNGFYVTLPVYRSKLIKVFREVHGLNQDAKPLTLVEQYSTLDYHDKIVLVVEDNELNQEIAKEMLEMVGVNVEIASNGKEALEMFLGSPEGKYDLIFMDIQMPVMNGYEATLEIRNMGREDARNVPIIAMTANAFNEDIQKALEVGMNEHLAKPIDIKKFETVLSRWL